MSEIVIICIGSDMVSGDSLGPTVGTILRDKINISCFVYGCLGRPVNACNLDEYLYFIKENHPDASIIAVDACMGKSDKEIGKIKISYKGIVAGQAIDSERNNRIGDIGLVGIVAKMSDNNINELLAVPYDDVYSLAQKMAEKVVGLAEAN